MKLTGKIKELTALTSAICMLSVPAATTALATTGTKISSVPLLSQKFRLAIQIVM